MAQSLNKTITLQTTGVSYLGIGSKVGKFLVGDQAIEFYPDTNVEQYIQIPWTSIQQMGANVSGKSISRHFEILTDQGKFLFASKDSGRILKIARQELGNDKVVKLPTLLQTIGKKLFGKR
ncbi:DUF956 family protein [Streptococcus cuniculipharyngis]|uniref:DUF956 family protein n=1 Tax=Streptococcus cuniculipharyngis TaxID=1562651 RepID=A0A5C5S8R1_9STRE|nr:DUF956 family protein [Streptococcus cuniculipharyngis]TWS96698.1 DUF956 family protein [Streptococcus cuniculipharyngis]